MPRASHTELEQFLGAHRMDGFRAAAQAESWFLLRCSEGDVYQMRKLSRRQVVVLGALIAWATLLALGFVGERIPGAPRAVTTTAGLIAAVGGFFLIPSWLLYGLLQEPGARDGSVSWLAIKWRWQSAISGTLVAVVGILLLLRGTRAPLEIRVATVIAFVWGGFCVWSAVLAFRKKALTRVPIQRLPDH